MDAFWVSMQTENRELSISTRWNIAASGITSPSVRNIPITSSPSSEIPYYSLSLEGEGRGEGGDLLISSSFTTALLTSQPDFWPEASQRCGMRGQPDREG